VELRASGKVGNWGELGTGGFTVPTEKWDWVVDLWGGRVERRDLGWIGAGLDGSGFAGRKVCPQFTQGAGIRWKSGWWGMEEEADPSRCSGCKIEPLIFGDKKL
jgi:hypothetical protein